jgi:hypothetical protein
MPSRNTLRHPFPKILSSQQLLQTLTTVLRSIDGVSYHDVPVDGTEHATPALLASTTQNTWSRSARRKKLSQPNHVSGNFPLASTEMQNSALKCLIRCSKGEDREEQEPLNLEVSWTEGRDRLLFESFWNHVCRRIIDET